MARLIEQLARLPGIGERTAARLAFYILRADRQYAQALAEAVLAVKDETRLCSVCFALTEADPCPICTDPGRLADAICVVEEPADLLAVERAWEFRGRYHVLHGPLAPLDGVGPDELKIQPLLARLPDGAVREVIIATTPTAEGASAQGGRRGLGASRARRARSAGALDGPPDGLICAARMRSPISWLFPGSSVGRAIGCGHRAASPGNR